MKKIITILAVIGMFGFQSCEGPEGIPGRDGFDGVKGDPGFVSEVFELKDFDFGYSSKNVYTIYQKLTPNISASDVVLIYRLSDIIDSSTPVWQLIPRTIYLSNNRKIDYDFDFSKEDFTIYARGNYDLESTPDYLDKQTFRIVIVPGSFSTSIDKSNYLEVMSALNIKENQIQKINF